MTGFERGHTMSVSIHVMIDCQSGNRPISANLTYGPSGRWAFGATGVGIRAGVVRKMALEGS